VYDADLIAASELAPRLAGRAAPSTPTCAATTRRPGPGCGCSSTDVP